MSEHFISIDAAGSDLLAAASYVAERIPAGDDHAEAISAVVPLYLARGEVDLAAEFANAVDDPFARDRLLIGVAEKCASIDDDEYARQLIDAVDDPGLRSEGMERLGIRKAEMGQLDAARGVAEEMLHPEFVNAAIAVRQAADGQAGSAAETIDGIAFPTARVNARCGIAQAMISADDSEAASGHLSAAVDDALEIEHDEEKVRALIEIGNLFLEAGMNDKAIGAFDKARELTEVLDNIHRDGFFAGISIGFLRAGSEELSDRALDLVADKTQMATALVGHSTQFWKEDRKDDAIEALDEAYEVLRSQRESETRSSRERFGLFTSIAAQFAGFGKGERAIEIAERIEDEENSMSALTQIAAILTRQGNESEARHAVKAITDEGQRVFALLGMSDAEHHSGNTERALELLTEAIDLIESIPQLSVRASALNAIAERAAASRNEDLLDKAFNEIAATVAGMRSELFKVKALADLCRVADKYEIELPAEYLAKLGDTIRSSAMRSG